MDIEFEFETGKMKICNKKGEEFVVLFDKTDLEAVQKYNWHISVSRTTKKLNQRRLYCRNNKKQYLHSLLTNPEKGFVVDHINHNSLDNRRCNLRVTTNQVNMSNQNALFGVYCAGVNNPNKPWLVRWSNSKKGKTKYFADLQDAWSYRRELELQILGFTNKPAELPLEAKIRFEDKMQEYKIKNSTHSL